MNWFLLLWHCCMSSASSVSNLCTELGLFRSEKKWKQQLFKLLSSAMLSSLDLARRISVAYVTGKWLLHARVTCCGLKPGTDEKRALEMHSFLKHVFIWVYNFCFVRKVTLKPVVLSSEEQEIRERIWRIMYTLRLVLNTKLNVLIPLSGRA